ncbi:modular protein with glycoside hydrolase family 13 and glycosyltransferase family 5 domains [Mycena maculata]|uniref:alpha-1,3-glucan synthase n=1 Tax=Mycena maculata TaxID=230809 RepID=A0AAD7K674_9AGAR|nr:modular protein with glycoside hydrolase family 13 and glycosyltransferase family 5 domains [Mycena maculata]
MRLHTALSLFSFLSLATASPYRADLVDYNLNVNQQAADVTEYTTTRSNTTYTPSPENWRALPTYTVLMDKWADGDPTNNDFFGTMYETDWRETQLRTGGDLKGLVSKLDYLYGMGIRTIYVSGTPFINMLWGADSYSPLDFSVLDPHWGNIADWVDAIDKIHAKGMYFMADLTVGTMADLLGFVGYLNVSAPFDLNEHEVIYKNPARVPWGFSEYADFTTSSIRNTSCVLPQFWNDSGSPITLETDGCLESEFDQYGDTEAFGVFPDYQRELSKFASVQDRLREWKPSVLAKLKVFSCMVITALDIDAIRIDKSTQVTVDALAEWSSGTRSCAANLGKKNFYITGEVTGGNTFGSIYLGRGRTPDQIPESFSAAANLTADMDEYFLRDAGLNCLDGVAFHYSIYRALTRFLGMDGNLLAAFDLDTNFVSAWNQMFTQNDFLNAQTGVMDPRHLLGTSNFDVYRWPSLQNGTAASILATFITNLVMPGVPLYYYGEEQNFYIFDNLASNYLYGRQAMSSTQAWKRHGCYPLGSEQYYLFPLEASFLGCKDDRNTLDHFDPTSDLRRLFARFLHLRSVYGALQDGFALVQLGNWTYDIQRPGSNGVVTEMGLWSVSRSGLTSPNQTLSGTYNDVVWMLFSNENATTTLTYDCNDSLWISTPFQADVTVRNLFYPYEEYTLEASQSSYFNDSKAPYYGCLGSVTMDGMGFKALVPVAQWVAPLPALTRFVPGHDARILANPTDENATTVDISLEFNTAMTCDSVTNALSFNLSSSGQGSDISVGSISCTNVTQPGVANISGGDVSVWAWSATLSNFADGILTITLDNPESSGGVKTGAIDTLLIRKGQSSNVMVFPTNDYNSSLFTYADGQYTYTHSAYGAELFRFSANFGQNWMNWTAWEDTTTIDASVFQNSSNFWEGDHIMVQYWSSATMSVESVIHADYNYSGSPRRVPRFMARGPFNSYGYDSGLPSTFEQNSDGLWELTFMAAWPAYVQLNVWDILDDYYYGDADGDGVMDRLPPNAETPNYLNMSAPPPPYVSWAILVNDADMTWTIEPRGQSLVGLVIYALLLAIPFITGTAAVVIFMRTFYRIRHNQYGAKTRNHQQYFPLVGIFKNKFAADLGADLPVGKSMLGHKNHEIIGWPEDKKKRRKVLIATLEYEIFDWKVKVKIGGLGVMSSLMGKAMTDVDLIWVVPKVKDVEYPAGDPAEPIEIIIFGEPYLIQVETHVLDNITYIILDSPVFRGQTKADPYPARMDDLSSAIFYSTWNQAIAATIRRSPTIDIYHINDYHGSLAPLHLLPKVIPVCLSLHNAEFQGLWPLRTKEEMKEVCSAFNLSKEHCVKYVQFGNTFNLLHAGASYISIHQDSVGVAGVSEKYGKRSWARYPALWTLKHVDSLPNPDPSDIAALDENPTEAKDVEIDQAAEAARPELKRQAQEWAGIAQDPNSDLFVFVGRWSKQKGVDLIADVMPSLLEKRPSIQLIAVGPVIDLYGRFAAEKLARLMVLYPGRVYSKPEFTALPPYLFSGADFALIPSRDEPFGLVAVEFGRKGALGVGSRLGGLGLMPGWWYPVESSATAHMLSQLTKTIKMALKSTEEERAVLRARSALQRFPVVEWRQRIEDFHKRSINISRGNAGASAWRKSDCDGGGMAAIEHTEDWDLVSEAHHSSSPMYAPLHSSGSQETLTQDESLHVPNNIHGIGHSYDSVASSDAEDLGSDSEGYDNFLERANRTIAWDQRHAPDPFLDASAQARPFASHRISSASSISSIVDEKASSPLNKAIASFTDADGGVAAEFIQKLEILDSKNSEHELSIEKFLVKSEEKFFGEVRKEKIAEAESLRSSKRDSVWGSPSPSPHSRPSSPNLSGLPIVDYHDGSPDLPGVVPMTRLQILMGREIFDWPLYTIIIGLGQMISATSYQMTLLTGKNYQNNTALYILGGFFLGATFVWYPLFRLKPAIWVLGLPWFFFSIAFFLIGLPSISSKILPVHQIIAEVATWSYAIASAAGFAFFGLNFGEEAGAATEVWTLRACIVQGSQQLWVAALWYWGNTLDNVLTSYVPSWWICIAVWPLSAISLLFGILMLYGMPDYYRQAPPKVHDFLTSLFRRKLVIWFLISEALRDYWLSGPYGRNWTFLWSSETIPKYQILLLILTFFIGVWSAMLLVLTQFSKTHTWILPVFAVGLGAPRWCQILWGTSSIALYLPWAGKSGPYLGISLWLWLGVLDAVQGVGLGMILLQTLSRLHVCVTLVFAQIIGTVITMVARATSPDRLGPGTVFPDAAIWAFSDGLGSSMIAESWFWVALVCQIIIVVGYFVFYRSEQLSRP